MNTDSVFISKLGNLIQNYTLNSNESHSTLQLHEIQNNDIYICASLIDGYYVYLGFYSFRK